MATSLRREPLSKSLADAAVSFLLIPYVVLTLLVLLLRQTEFGALFLFFLMLMVWSGDVAAYYVGRAIGKHKLAPRISPGKTWEGAIASAVGAVVVGVLLFAFINPIADGFRNVHLLKDFRPVVALASAETAGPIPHLARVVRDPVCALRECRGSTR